MLSGALVVVPLACAAVGDHFTTPKWHVLAIASTLALATAELSWARGVGVQRRRFMRVIALVLVLGVANGLRSGVGWSLEPLLARLTFVGLTACAYGAFARNGGDTRPVARALAIPLTVVVVIGLAQVTGFTRAWGLEPLFGLAAGDGRSVTFGNVNMAAQFVGFAVAFLIAHATRDDGRHRPPTVLAGGALVAAGVVYMLSVGARSASLALATAVIVTALLLARARWNRWRTVTLIAASGGLALAVVGATAISAFTSPLKAESVHLRARLWAQTAKLIADHPLGVGSGNFVHAFLPYQLADARVRSETVVYASPHNEFLRALAEEGVVWCALAAYLLVSLGLAVRRRARAERWPGPAVVIAASTAFIGIEALFQFPFALAFGALAGAMTLGVALSYVQTTEPTVPPVRKHAWAPGLARMVLAALAAVALARIVMSDYWTATAPRDAARLSRACALNPRNFRACLDAAWLDANAGHRRRARQRLAALLDRSPHYYPAIALLADDSFAQGDARAGCFYTWIYDTLFEGRSSRHEMLAARCSPRLLEGFAREVKVPGYERFPMTVPAAGP